MALKIFLATRNKGKIREIRGILSGIDLELIGADDVEPYPEPAEDGETFLENALAKARAAFDATGLPALADDSGLEVEALDGRPGVRSARYGGKGISDGERCLKLLGELSDVPAKRRDARFHCTMVLYPRPGGVEGRRAAKDSQAIATPGGSQATGKRRVANAGRRWTAEKYLATEGFLYGRIAAHPAGSNGFGYDPVFLLPDRGVTVAQLPLEEKNQVSHRYRALVEMKWLLVRECGVALIEK